MYLASQILPHLKQLNAEWQETNDNDVYNELAYYVGIAHLVCTNPQEIYNEFGFSDRYDHVSANEAFESVINIVDMYDLIVNWDGDGLDIANDIANLPDHLHFAIDIASAQHQAWLNCDNADGARFESCARLMCRVARATLRNSDQKILADLGLFNAPYDA